MHVRIHSVCIDGWYRKMFSTMDPLIRAQEESLTVLETALAAINGTKKRQRGEAKTKKNNNFSVFHRTSRLLFLFTLRKGKIGANQLNYIEPQPGPCSAKLAM